MRAVEEKIQAALSGKLTLADTRDLTITWNNTGVLGGTAPDSIIPYAVSRDGSEYPTGFIFNITAFEEVGGRMYSNLVFRFDHRLTDGKQASGFAHALKAIIEAPIKPDDFWDIFDVAQLVN